VAAVLVKRSGQPSEGEMMSEIRQLVLQEPARDVTPVLRPRPGRSTPHPANWDAPSRLPESPAPADGPTRVYLYAKDAILRGGVASQLRRSPQVTLAEEYGFDAEGVAIVAADEICEELIGAIRAIRRSCTSKVIVIANRLTRAEAEAAVAAGAWAFVRRSDVRPDSLVSAVRAVALAEEPPANVEVALGNLIEQLEPDLPVAPGRPPGLTDRDVEVLRLMADGQSTAGIARDLSYSESTIKNIIHAIVRELGARNRAHAVAMALRSQLI
jgi:DNA-binding NarL/FixJ family response regulator